MSHPEVAGPEPALPAAITLRSETPEDLPWLAALYAQVRADELAPVPWSAAAKEAFLLDQFQRQHAYYRSTYLGAEFLVVEREHTLIGRLYVHRGVHEIRLMDIALDAAQRGRGLGSLLLARLMVEAAAADKELTLHVEPENRARRLYARLGFRLIEERGVYHFLGWTPPRPHVLS
ncbi:MAG: GNAT family N-acetyltransferase [Dokdonella sp.]